MLTRGLRSGIRSVIRNFSLDVRRIADGEPGVDSQSDMKRLVGDSPRPLIFDVGANIGQTIDTFRATFPGAVIHSFEPGTDAFAALDRNYSGRPDIHLNNIALGSVPGRQEFIESIGSDMSSFLEPTVEKKGSIKQRIEVQVSTLDVYCDSRNVQRTDVLKTDTQGFDLELLKGADRMFAANTIRLVYVEINFSDLYKKAARLDEVFGFLADRNMKFVTFYEFYYREGRTDWTGGLFVNPDYSGNRLQATWT